MTPPATFLVADIGGTNTRIGFADAKGLRADTPRRYRNAAFTGFDGVLERYLEETTPGPIAAACVGAAGPVRDGVARMTNLSWTIDRDMLARVTGADVTDVINDLQAQGHALDDLAPGALTPVLEGPDLPGAARLVIGLGTGFNSVVVHHDDGHLVVPSAETGHASLPLHRDFTALADWLHKDHGYPSIESVLSGMGLSRLYRFYGGSTLSGADIVAAEARGDDPIAKTTLESFVRLMGIVAGDLALTHLPFGGILFTGGVARSVSPHFARLGFAESFRAKGNFSELMKQFRIDVIDDDFAALKGCADHLRHLTGADKDVPARV